ncbi:MULTISPECIES: hypothetical protein [unclassified Duganella]|uniref:hypothetical protein n=1 Tax=unclassified Duganella TaxID=2636909 RepID=UPI0011C1B5DA|nr:MULTISPECIES: hypothetical protein [unclassified Duganella]
MASRILRCAPALMCCDADRDDVRASRAQTSSVSRRDAARSSSPFLQRHLRDGDAPHRLTQFAAAKRQQMSALRFESTMSVRADGERTVCLRYEFAADTRRRAMSRAAQAAKLRSNILIIKLAYARWEAICLTL